MSWFEFNASVGYSYTAFIKISSLVLRLSGVPDIIDVDNTNNDSNKCERIVKEMISEEVNGRRREEWKAFVLFQKPVWDPRP